MQNKTTTAGKTAAEWRLTRLAPRRYILTTHTELTATEADAIVEEQGAFSSEERKRNIAKWHADEAAAGVI